MSVYGYNFEPTPWDAGMKENARLIRQYRTARRVWTEMRAKYLREVHARVAFTNVDRLTHALSKYCYFRNRLLDNARFYPYNKVIIKKFP